MAEAVWSGPGAARVLTGGGRGSVVAAFGGGGYLRLPGGFVLLAPAGSPRGPLTLIVDRLRAPARRACVAVIESSLAVGADVIGLERCVDADGVLRASGSAAAGVAPLADVAIHATDAHAAAAAAAAQAAVPAPADELRPGIAALAAGHPDRAARLLAGLGDGLTPAGDDVLAGHAARRWAIGDPVASRDRVTTERCSPIGLAYLECARRGELPEFAAAVLDAIAAGDARGAARLAGRCTEWGASSGAALVWGMTAEPWGLNERPVRVETAVLATAMA